MHEMRPSDLTRANDELVTEFGTHVADAERRLAQAAEQDAAVTTAPLAEIRQRLDAMKRTLGEWQHSAARTSRHAARATDEYVHRNAWQVVALAACAGLIVGILARRR